jgi:hypothetical protein
MVYEITYIYGHSRFDVRTNRYVTTETERKTVQFEYPDTWVVCVY